jgi:hypothetical protein
MTKESKPQLHISDSTLVDRKKMKKKEKPFHLHDHHHQQQPTHQEIHALDMTEYQNLKLFCFHGKQETEQQAAPTLVVC